MSKFLRILFLTFCNVVVLCSLMGQDMLKDSNSFYEKLAQRDNGALFIQSVFLKNRWVGQGEYVVCLYSDGAGVSSEVIIFKGGRENAAMLRSRLDLFLEKKFNLEELFSGAESILIPLIITIDYHSVKKGSDDFEVFLQHVQKVKGKAINHEMWPPLIASYYP